MKNYFYLMLIGFLTLAVTTGACKKDDDDDIPCTAEALSTEIQSEIDALIAAGEAYGNDPSNANCNAYRDALGDYVDFLKQLRSCAIEIGYTAAEWDAAISEAETEVADFEC